MNRDKVNLKTTLIMKNIFYLTLTVCLTVFTIGCKEETTVKETNNKLELKLAGYD